MSAVLLISAANLAAFFKKGKMYAEKHLNHTVIIVMDAAQIKKQKWSILDSSCYHTFYKLISSYRLSQVTDDIPVVNTTTVTALLLRCQNDAQKNPEQNNWEHAPVFRQKALRVV